MKKALIITSSLFLILTVFQITKSFGVFETRFTEDSNINIAKWHIYVNDYNLNNTNNTFYVDNITYINNEGVSEGRFAPGVTGSFLLEIERISTRIEFTCLVASLTTLVYNKLESV